MMFLLVLADEPLAHGHLAAADWLFLVAFIVALVGVLAALTPLPARIVALVVPVCLACLALAWFLL